MSKYDSTSEKLNDVWINGFAEEEYGSCDEDGFQMALIITEDMYGIISEDDQGFVTYEVFSGEEDARDQWNKEVLIAEYEREFNMLIDSTGTGSWDFRTLSYSRGSILADKLVRLGILDNMEDRFKHYVPRPSQVRLDVDSQQMAEGHVCPICKYELGTKLRCTP